MPVDITSKKQKNGFQPGQSGNPNGRPKGSRNKATLAAERLLEGEAEGITRVCIDRALGGDMTAIRLCMDRIYPPRKDRPLGLNLGYLETPSDLTSAMSEVFSALGRGEITPTEAQAVAGLVETSRRSFETRDIEQRLAALEKSNI